MNQFFRSSVAAIVLGVALIAANSSCNKKFDQPPVYVAPAITPNTTIKQLKALLTATGTVAQITTDAVIRGIVIGDDKSGNLYKSLVIQDATGGILLRMEGTNLFTSYPVGQEVFVKCKGLYLGDYNKLIQLGGGIDNSGTTPTATTIPSALFDQYIVRGSAANVVQPKVVTVAQLTTDLQDSLQNRLIKLEGFEFAAADTTKTYANAITNPPGSVNFVLKNCAGNSITLRNSGFADFAAIGVPNGNGSIVAIYTVFGSTKQLTIRDTSDVQFTGTRCSGGVTPPPPPSGNVTSLADLRAMYNGTDIKITASTTITGIVISDAASKNINKSSVIIQDGNSGINVYFGSSVTVNYNVGDSVVIDITGDSLIKFRGSLEVKAASAHYVAAVATGKTVTAATVTLAQLNTALGTPLGNPSNIEYILVKVVDATATGSPATFSGSKTLTDASGNIVLFTASAATFSADGLPASAKIWTGYGYFFNSTKELSIRNPTLDIK